MQAATTGRNDSSRCDNVNPPRTCRSTPGRHGAGTPDRTRRRTPRSRGDRHRVGVLTSARSSASLIACNMARPRTLTLPSSIVITDGIVARADQLTRGCSFVAGCSERLRACHCWTPCDVVAARDLRKRHRSIEYQWPRRTPWIAGRREPAAAEKRRNISSAIAAGGSRCAACRREQGVPGGKASVEQEALAARRVWPGVATQLDLRCRRPRPCRRARGWSDRSSGMPVTRDTHRRVVGVDVAAGDLLTRSSSSARPAEREAHHRCH